MRVDILGVQIDAYNMNECVARITKAVDEHSNLRVVTANPEMIYAASHNFMLRSIVNSAGLITADGVGVVWAARHLGNCLPERVTGIDLLQALFPVADRKQWRVFFLGSKPGVADLAANKIAEKYKGFTWQAAHGYFEAEEEAIIINKIKAFQPDILLAGLGVPKQEFWLNDHPDLAAVSIGVGGSFDTLAGLMKRAPQFMINIHLEWLYRLWQEPRRWRRQLVLPKYALKILFSGRSLE